MAARYRQFLKVIEQWPLDPTKSKKRDLGHLLRTRISEEFSHGETTEVKDPIKCDKMLQSLKNISENKYSKQYPWPRETGCSTGKYGQVHFALSEEGLELIAERSYGIVKRTVYKLKRSLRRKKTDS